MLQPPKARNQQTSANQEDERQGDFRDQEHVASADLTRSAPRGTGGLFQVGRKIYVPEVP